MKLLLASKEETINLNINYLSSLGVKVVYSYNDFTDALHTCSESLGFTTQAIALFSTPTAFINLLEASQLTYGYHIFYFSDYVDSLTISLNTNSKASILSSIRDYSELEINEKLNILTPVHINLPSYLSDNPVTLKEKSIFLKKVSSLQNKRDITEDEKEYLKLLKQTLRLLELEETHTKDLRLLSSQRTNAYNLLCESNNELKTLTEQFNQLLQVYNTNYSSLNYYKNILDSYKITLDSLNKHGLPNLQQDCFTPVKFKKIEYPIKILYFKQVTSCNYLTTCVESLARLMTKRNILVKIVRLTDKYNTQKLRRYSSYFNTSNGFLFKDYINNTKFIQLGSPQNLLTFVAENEVPIDVLIVLDETALDLIHVDSSNNTIIYTANDYTDITGYHINPILSLTNSNASKGGTSTNFILEHSANFSKYDDNPKYIDLFYQQIPIVTHLIHFIEGGE